MIPSWASGCVGDDERESWCCFRRFSKSRWAAGSPRGRGPGWGNGGGVGSRGWDFGGGVGFVEEERVGRRRRREGRVKRGRWDGRRRMVVVMWLVIS